MKPYLKPLDQQVIVITGASSGIGLATARSAADKGAKLVLAARSAQTLQDIVHAIEIAGGKAVAVACDVADQVAPVPASLGCPSVPEQIAYLYENRAAAQH